MDHRTLVIGGRLTSDPVEALMVKRGAASKASKASNMLSFPLTTGRSSLLYAPGGLRLVRCIAYIVSKRANQIAPRAAAALQPISAWFPYLYDINPALVKCVLAWGTRYLLN